VLVETEYLVPITSEKDFSKLCVKSPIISLPDSKIESIPFKIDFLDELDMHGFDKGIFFI
jgi:hypothetical protein